MFWSYRGVTSVQGTSLNWTVLLTDTSVIALVLQTEGEEEIEYVDEEDLDLDDEDADMEDLEGYSDDDEAYSHDGDSSDDEAGPSGSGGWLLQRLTARL